MRLAFPALGRPRHCDSCAWIAVDDLPMQRDLVAYSTRNAQQTPALLLPRQRKHGDPAATHLRVGRTPVVSWRTADYWIAPTVRESTSLGTARRAITAAFRDDGHRPRRRPPIGAVVGGLSAALQLSRDRKRALTRECSLTLATGPSP